jgi:hypothetical protein
MFSNNVTRMGVMSLIFFTAGLQACKRSSAHNGAPAFSDTPEGYKLSSPMVVEASGLADSKRNPGYLWVEQDSGNPPDLFLIKHDGTVLKSVHLAGVENRDWEDITLSAGPDPKKQYLYLAETGDNLVVHTDYAIYRLEEPDASVDTVQKVDKIPFFYPDGSHNAEAILVDPDTKDIYIITKTDLRSKIFKLSYPYSTTDMNQAVEVGQLSFNFATSAAISPSGKDIVVKTYDAIYYYPRNKGETILQALAKQPVTLPYVPEPQGEGICFDAADSGYYTISEKGLASSVKLYFYRRLKS